MHNGKFNQVTGHNPGPETGDEAASNEVEKVVRLGDVQSSEQDRTRFEEPRFLGEVAVAAVHQETSAIVGRYADKYETAVSGSGD
jgi:hypothetical protein